LLGGLLPAGDDAIRFGARVGQQPLRLPADVSGLGVGLPIGHVGRGAGRGQQSVRLGAHLLGVRPGFFATALGVLLRFLVHLPRMLVRGGDVLLRRSLRQGQYLQCLTGPDG
jgi:hypothetical protein